MIVILQSSKLTFWIVDHEFSHVYENFVNNTDNKCMKPPLVNQLQGA